jgi:hypothetical protein
MEGELDNTVPNKVTGWIQFAGMEKKATFDLTGDFHRDIRGAKIRFVGDGKPDDPAAAKYMEGMAEHQTGKAGDITAGLPPQDYSSRPYIELYGDENGRIVLELEPEQVTVIGQPIPACESDPVSREKQRQNMTAFLGGMARELGLPPGQTICIGAATALRPAQEATARKRPHRMPLLTQELRRKLPPLGSQDGKGGKAVVWATFFSPDAGWRWHVIEGQEEGNDFLFFGLVEGQEKELGYFRLSELQSARGPMGLPIERDLHWTPRTLEEIAPEMFTERASP